MTVIKYRINNQTGRDLTADDWESAQVLRQKTQDEELAQFNWWSVIALITNNDGTTIMGPIDANGNPLMYDEETGTFVPFVDKTTVPD